MNNDVKTKLVDAISKALNISSSGLNIEAEHIPPIDSPITPNPIYPEGNISSHSNTPTINSTKLNVGSVLNAPSSKSIRTSFGVGNYKFLQKYGQNIYKPDESEKLKLSNLFFPGVPGSSDNKKFISTYLSEIPALADGGIVSTPTIAMVGEKGPEMIVPLGKSSHSILPSVSNTYTNMGNLTMSHSSQKGQMTDQPSYTTSSSPIPVNRRVVTPLPSSSRNDNLVSYGKNSFSILDEEFASYTPPRAIL